ncbi:MAG: type II toxin-antitoxin system PemK/MazF family toxin [Candidatus Poribacteria bacterium]|nr:type II toxin-antitoxin system PemK/MazF family toxin [Candidatus Poribacteria bacterium]
MNPRRGEIWLADLNPTLGAENRKTRPIVVVSSDDIGVLPIRFVAPITEWKESFVGNVWHVRLDPELVGGLTKTSAVDTLQLRGIDTLRFVRKIGEVPQSIMSLILTAIAAVIEYEPVLP